MTFGLTFGVLALKPSDQINIQPKSEARRIDTIATQITSLHMEGILTDAEAQKARSRLVKRIGRVVVPEA